MFGYRLLGRITCTQEYKTRPVASVVCRWSVSRCVGHVRETCRKRLNRSRCRLDE